MENLGRFGHHPDPVIDFEIEVESLQGLSFEWRHGAQTIGNTADLLCRFNHALGFRFVPGGPCQATMDALRAIAYPIEDHLLSLAV